MSSFAPFIPALVVALFNTGLQVSGYQNFNLAVALWSVAGLLCLIPLWCYRAECRRRIVAIMPEPVVIQIIGLIGVMVFAAVALFGVLQQNRTAVSEPAVTSAPQSNPPNALEKAAEYAARFPSPPPKIMTAPADVPKKLAAIDSLREILNAEMVPWINKGNGFSTASWWNWVAGNEIPQLKEQARYFWHTADEIDGKLKQLQKENELFPDIYALAESPLGRPFHLKAQKLVTPILSLPDEIGGFKDFYRFAVEPAAKETYEMLQSLESWRVTTDRNALELRKQISQ